MQIEQSPITAMIIARCCPEKRPSIFPIRELTLEQQTSGQICSKTMSHLFIDQLDVDKNNGER
jgi:hypothetical protein